MNTWLQRVDKKLFYSILSLFLIAIVFTLPVLSRVFSAMDLCFQIMAAVLGVVLSAVITFVLLNAQSHTEVQQERTAKIYEQKLAVCRDFLNNLRNILEDGKVTEEEYNRMRFSLAEVGLHVTGKSLDAISGQLQEIISNCGPGPQAGQNKKDGGNESVLYCVLQIVDIFRKEIYGHQQDGLSGEQCKNICNNLNDIEQGQTEKAVSQESLKEAGSPYQRLLSSVAEKLRSALDKTWQVQATDHLDITKEGMVDDSFVIRLTWDGGAPEKQYFQCHLEFEDDGLRRTLYLPMRGEFGGYFTKYCWWQWLEQKYNDVLFSPDCSSEDIAQTTEYCVRKLMSIVHYMDTYFQRHARLDKIVQGTGLDAGSWKWGLYGNKGYVIRNYSLQVYVEVMLKDDGGFAAPRIHMDDGATDTTRAAVQSAFGKDGTAGLDFYAAATPADDAALAAQLKRLADIR